LLTSLAIFIACLGLYGLSIFMVEQKTKEIGIRKILGASIQGLVHLLAKDIILLILIASFIALPIVWSLLDRWLENYPYRIEITWWILLSPILGIAVIALLTISSKVFKAATTNPVETIRNE